MIYFTTHVSGALLCAETWNTPNFTWQGHAMTKEGGFNATIHYPEAKAVPIGCP